MLFSRKDQATGGTDAVFTQGSIPVAKATVEQVDDRNLKVCCVQSCNRVGVNR